MNQDQYGQLEAIIRLFRDRGLEELTVEEDSLKISLRRGRPDPPASAMVVLPPRPEQPAASVPEPDPTRRPRTVAVRSPLIGLFYRAASPDSPSFVELGDLVQEGQTVCIVEAMKVFNEIKAEWSGRVVAIPAENGKLVQAGEPLVVLEFQLDHE